MTTAHDVTAIGALADPVRRRLYQYVARQHDAVSREAAAEAVSIPLSKAKFHLDRLADEGLLDIEFRRLSGKSGPGAGRPAKLYRRSPNAISVSLPERRYDIMGRILAAAVEQAQHGMNLSAAIAASAYDTGVSAIRPVSRESTADAESTAEAVGTTGAESTAGAVGSADPENPEGSDAAAIPVDESDTAALARAASTLENLGYEPEEAPGELRLRNCPFDALAQEHRTLVCTSNERYVQGVLDASGCGQLRAHLEPQPGYCCIIARPRSADSASTACMCCSHATDPSPDESDESDEEPVAES